MKNLKIRSFSIKSFFKRNKTKKSFNKFSLFINAQINKIKSIFYRFRLKNIEVYVVEKFRVNYALFFLSILFFLYLLYLSIPGILVKKSLQNELETKLKKEYNFEFALTPEIKYSILPKPHYVISDVIIFTEKSSYQKEFSQIKKLKIFINQNNFINKKIEIKKIEISEANFFIEKSDFNFLQRFLKNGFSSNSIKIQKSKIFYKNDQNQIVSFLNLNNIFIYYDELKKQNIMSSQGKIFNIPFSFEWKNDKNLNENLTKIILNSLKLNVTNKSFIDDKKKTFRINFKRSKLIFDYFLEKDKILLKSSNSFLGTDKFFYEGTVDFDPFDFKIKSKIDKLDLSDLNPSQNIFKEIFSRDVLLNNNLNGQFSISSNKLINAVFFNEIFLNWNFVGEKIELNNSFIENKKIAKLLFESGSIYKEENSLMFQGLFNFEIFNINKFNRKFVVAKKNQKDIKKISFGINTNLNTMDTKIFHISINDKDSDVNEILDELIYDYNNNSIKVNNWISLKSFVNKIFSSYSG
ncbi:AsmA family protein [Candidatus Pelagibacter communis]|uniref:AsmA family protein n=1 Tax=Pelagibacter ubique TaxID=198252 RepID=UPI00094D8214|nr:AsmA family protein [Candidatus Pelagibacter ubique]